MKYREKPVFVEATQWLKHGDHPSVIKYDSEIWCSHCQTSPKEHGMLSGGRIVCPGSWIVEQYGQVSVVHPEVFKATYEPVT